MTREYGQRQRWQRRSAWAVGSMVAIVVVAIITIPAGPSGRPGQGCLLGIGGEDARSVVAVVPGLILMQVWLWLLEADLLILFAITIDFLLYTASSLWAQRRKTACLCQDRC